MVEETVQYTVPDGTYQGPVPVPMSYRDYDLPRTRYTLHFKGNTLVDISPRKEGKYLRP